MSKKLLALWLAVAGFCGMGFAAQISLDPQYADARFAPSDSFHAGCLNEITVSLKSTAKENISSLRLLINYDPTAIQILNIKPADKFKNILDTQIEYDKIVATVLDAPISGNTTKLFTIAFKSNENATGTLFAIRKPSYVMSKSAEKTQIFVEQNVSFSKVTECEPDSLPPTITLVKPLSESGFLAIDNYFVFSIKDTGKWVDKNTLRVHFAGKTYSWSDSALVWNNDNLTFYPSTWLPLNTGLDLSIRIADKQVYGWANETKKIFNFKTATWVLFDQNLTPAMLRAALDKISTVLASPEECSGMIASFITSKDLSQLWAMSSLAQKMWCAFDQKAVAQTIQDNIQKKHTEPTFISVFALTGWILFVLSFFLKLHYIASSHKHKKIAKDALSSKWDL